MSKLPMGWASSTLGDVFKWGSGGTPSRTRPENFGGGIPWAVIGDLRDGVVNDTFESITERGFVSSSAKWIEEGSVMLAMYGSIGKLGIAGGRMTCNQAIAFFNPPEGIAAKYVFYYLMSIRSTLVRAGKGGTQSNISQTVIKEVPFVCAPTAEQRRIVEAVESYLSRLDAAVASLEQAQVRLKAYRASVLKAAVEGRLVPTEAELARAEGHDYEPADVLLKRILANRPRRREKAELGSTEVAGKRAKNDGWKAKYQDPASPDTRFLPELPEGWCWATVDQLGDTVTGTTPASESGLRISQAGSQSASALKTRIPFIKPTDLSAGENVSQARQYLSPHGVEQARLLPAGAVLVTCIGATIGKTGLARVPCATNQQINAWIPAAPLLHTRYGYWFFVGPVGRSQVIGQSSSTTLPILNKSRFRQIPVALPPVAEQERIVSEIERLLSSAQATDRAVRSNLRRLNRFRQAILKAAFEGKLVAQDPTDEPAEKLLERIRAERASSTPAKRKRPRKSKVAR